MEPLSDDYTKVKELGDGKYELTFKVEESGDYALEILQFLDDKATNIQSFPRDIKVQDSGLSYIFNTKLEDEIFKGEVDIKKPAKFSLKTFD